MSLELTFYRLILVYLIALTALAVASAILGLKSGTSGAGIMALAVATSWGSGNFAHKNGRFLTKSEQRRLASAVLGFYAIFQLTFGTAFVAHQAEGDSGALVTFLVIFALMFLLVTALWLSPSTL